VQSHDEIMNAWRLTISARHAILGLEEATQMPEVADFRRQWLAGGRLLDRSDRVVEAWLKAQVARANDAARETSELALNQERGRGVKRTIIGSAVEALKNRLIVAMTDGPDFEEIVPPLLACGALLNVSTHLHKIFGWTRSSAARWLIAQSAIPEIPDFRAAIWQTDRHPPEGAGPRWFETVTIQVPIDFPPSRLAREFEQFQKSYDGEFIFPIPAARPAAAANMKKCIFAIQRNDGKHTWKDVVREWNLAYPSDQQEITRKGIHLFAKSVRQTYQALMGPNRSLKWKTAGDS